MLAVVVHAVIHPFTPGSPAYGLAKLGAIGGVFALRMVFKRRERRSEDDATAPAAERPAPHPVSARKARRRRRRR